MFKAATKEKLKARIAIDAVSGGGKTYTALVLARQLAGPRGRIAVIDTEHRSASKYANHSHNGEPPWKFDVCDLVHYAPSAYCAAIKEAGKQGYEVLVIDSLSHAWEGVGGALDQVDRKASSTRGGSFAAWRDVTPQHRELIETILASPCHVIATMRTKTAYELEEYEENGRKRTRVQKIGTKPVQREGVEYEFDVVADMDRDHLLTISKSRCPTMDGHKASCPTGQFIQPLIDWLKDGADPAPREPQPEFSPAAPDTAAEAQRPRSGVKLSGKPGTNDLTSQGPDVPCGDVVAGQIKVLAKDLAMPADRLRAILAEHGVQKLAELPARAAAKLLVKLESKQLETQNPF